LRRSGCPPDAGLPRRREAGGADGVLHLDVAPGLAGNGDCDWTYLRDVTIRAAERG